MKSNDTVASGRRRMLMKTQPAPPESSCGAAAAEGFPGTTAFPLPAPGDQSEMQEETA